MDGFLRMAGRRLLVLCTSPLTMIQENKGGHRVITKYPYTTFPQGLVGFLTEAAGRREQRLLTGQEEIVHAGTRHLEQLCDNPDGPEKFPPPPLLLNVGNRRDLSSPPCDNGPASCRDLEDASLAILLAQERLPRQLQPMSSLSQRNLPAASSGTLRASTTTTKPIAKISSAG